MISFTCGGSWPLPLVLASEFGDDRGLRAFAAEELARASSNAAICASSRDSASLHPDGVDLNDAAFDIDFRVRRDVVMDARGRRRCMRSRHRDEMVNSDRAVQDHVVPMMMWPASITLFAMMQRLPICTSWPTWVLTISRCDCPRVSSRRRGSCCLDRAGVDGHGLGDVIVITDLKPGGSPVWVCPVEGRRPQNGGGKCFPCPQLCAR